MFLPKRYAVTSDFIIPNELVSDYDLLHYDVIIYDHLEAPVLWMDGDEDTSLQGTHRAIAKHVYGLFEVKASLTKAMAKQSLSKVSQLNAIRTHLPSRFSCGSVFFDFAPADAQKRDIIRELVDCESIVGYWGGMVLRCASNGRITGLFTFCSAENLNEAAPLFFEVDQFEIEVVYDNGLKGVQPGPGLAIMAMAWNNAWHFSKRHVAFTLKGERAVQLVWSYDMFTAFASELLRRLEGSPPKRDDELKIGRVFHAVPDNGRARDPSRTFLNVNNENVGLEGLR